MTGTDAAVDYGSGIYRFEFDSTKTPFAGAKMSHADINLYKYDGSSGSNAYVILKYTGSSEGSNNITVPDETGTMLTTSTSYGGNISIAATGGTNTITLNAAGEINVNSGTLDLSAQTVDVTLNNAVDALNFDSNTLSIDASNNRIGIGTAAPGKLLSLEGVSTEGIRIGVTGQSYYHEVLSNGDGLKLSADSSNAGGSGADIRFDVAGSEKMRIQKSGNVGIGNTVPQGKLTISEAAGNNAPSTITSANTYLHLGSGDFGPSSNGKFMIGFGYTAGATNTNSPAYIGFEESTTSGNTKGDLTFLTRDVTTDTAPTERMRIDSSGSITTPNGSFNGTIGSSASLSGGYLSGSKFDVTFYESGSGSADAEIWYKVPTECQLVGFTISSYHSTSHTAIAAVYTSAAAGSQTTNVWYREQASTSGWQTWVTANGTTNLLPVNLGGSGEHTFVGVRTTYRS